MYCIAVNEIYVCLKVWMMYCSPVNGRCHSFQSCMLFWTYTCANDQISLLRPPAAATADDVDFGPCPSAAIACVILGRPQVHTISIETDMLVLIEAADTNWEVVWQSENWSWVFIWDHCLLFFVGSKLKCSLDRGCREWNLKIWSWISLVLISFLDCKARRSRQLHLSGQGPAGCC